MSIRAIASGLGMSPTTVHTAVKEKRSPPDQDGMIYVGSILGLDGKVRPDRRYDTSGRDELIVRRRSEGAALRAIATEAGCSVGTVHRVLKRLD